MQKKNGFTVLELLMVVAIVGVLAAIISLPFSKFRNAQALQNSTNAVVALLNSARTKTLAAVNNTSYSVRIESSRAILYTGTTYSASEQTNEIVTYESPVTLSSISLNGGGSEVKFNRLKGTTSQYGTITLTLPDNQTRIITVSATGSVTRN